MLKEMIYKRCSIRRYKEEPLNDDTLKQIQDIIKTQKPLFDDILYQVDLVQDGKAFQKVLGGIVGGYGKIHAPHYLVTSTMIKEDAYENIGYLVEYIVLKLTEMNIGTCWIGGGIKRTLFSEFLELDDDLTPVVVIAFGKPLYEGMFRKEVDMIKRKSLDEIAVSEYEPYKDVMELVRLSPSAANTQPWRYEFRANHQVDLYRTKNHFIMKKFLGEMNRLDLGISLCHFEIGLNEKSNSFELVDLKKEIKNFIYYKTLLIK